MTSFAIDTNIFLYAHYSDYAEHKVVSSFLQDQIKQCRSFYLGWQVVYEYLRIVTHPLLLKKPISAKQGAEDMQVYIDDPRCVMLQETRDHLRTYFEIIRTIPHAQSSFVHDIHYATLLKEHAVDEILTCDTDFKKFDFLKVINPLVG